MELRQLKVNKNWNKTTTQNKSYLILAYLEYIHWKLLNCLHQSPSGFERNYANIHFIKIHKKYFVSKHGIANVN